MAPSANLELYQNEVSVEPGDAEYREEVQAFQSTVRSLSVSANGSPLEGLFTVWSRISQDSDFLYDLVHGCYYGTFYKEGAGSGNFLVVPFGRNGDVRHYLVMRNLGLQYGIMVETLEYNPSEKKDRSMRNQIRHVVLERENPHVGKGVVQKKLHRMSSKERDEVISILRSDETLEAIKAEAEDPIYLVGD